MTALLELKQRIKNLYSQYEIYILPVLRFRSGNGLFHMDQYQYGIYEADR